jgi:hypothetical protein
VPAGGRAPPPRATTATQGVFPTPRPARADTSVAADSRASDHELFLLHVATIRLDLGLADGPSPAGTNGAVALQREFRDAGVPQSNAGPHFYFQVQEPTVEGSLWCVLQIASPRQLLAMQLADFNLPPMVLRLGNGRPDYHSLSTHSHCFIRSAPGFTSGQQPSLHGTGAGAAFTTNVTLHISSDPRNDSGLLQRIGDIDWTVADDLLSQFPSTAAEAADQSLSNHNSGPPAAVPEGVRPTNLSPPAPENGFHDFDDGAGENQGRGAPSEQPRGDDSDLETPR